ncbi:hypothetical protein [Priestia megaterium]|uniref:hypothetical protein n=1 Tax=Priestia megaterium TaxID=1404 RepID=UPI0035A882CA
MIKVTLLENSYDFLHNSLNHFDLATSEASFEVQKRYLKFSLVDIVQSMELMFKEVLRRKNEFFIYENIDKPKHTVSISTALQRLKNIMRLNLEQKDEVKIKRAIDLRNQIIHFELELDIKELITIYIVIFEFIHSFHYRFLEEELHERIRPEYWTIEAKLMEKFEKEFVLYNGIEVNKLYPSEIAESQMLTYYVGKSQSYKRIKFGEEENLEFLSEHSRCGDCEVKQGYYHTLGCSLEICPKCGGQVKSCSCNLKAELF